MILTIDQNSDAGSSVAYLYEHFRRPILAHLTRLVGDQETAEDLCQETFLKALLHWVPAEQPAPGAAWLYRIATNTAYDHLRRRKRVRFLSLDMMEESADDSAAPEEQFDKVAPVHAALAQIPPQYRVPLLLYVCGGHSTREIATSLGCSNLAVRLRVSRARARFKQVYQSGG